MLRRIYGVPIFEDVLYKIQLTNTIEIYMNIIGISSNAVTASYSIRGIAYDMNFMEIRSYTKNYGINVKDIFSIEAIMPIGKDMLGIL